MVRLVLFDIDGTLIHSGGAGEKAFGHACAMEFGIQNGTANLKFSGRTDTGIVRELFTRHQIDPTKENFQRFFDCYVFWLDQTLQQTVGRVLPGVEAMLQQLTALGEPPLRGLLTGNIRLGAQIKLTHYGLWDQFTMGGFADDHEDRNCIADVARLRGEKLLRKKLRGEEILVIGDTPLDIECGKSIGARVLAVATGNFTLPELANHKPLWAVNSLDEISSQELCG